MDVPAFPPRLSLPDVSSESSALRGRLDWVGMQGIALPLRIDGERVLARADAYVDLAREDARGIHMSRLYHTLDRDLADHAPDAARLHGVLRDFLDSHAGLSERARLRLRFELPVRRRALRSGLGGWRGYPVELIALLADHRFQLETAVQVEYSSTCPGSAALARQVIQQGFERDFPRGDPARASLLEWLGSSRGIGATPHAQRSVASVRVRGGELAPATLIDGIEAALATPVQTAVKREDEQEFARLNGENPMYCEDAVRRIRVALEAQPIIIDYAIRAAHLESLHPHDAVAVAVRGVPGGFVATPD